jgi:peptidoglycan/LPS O-acetylase OafA/YrhL
VRRLSFVPAFDGVRGFAVLCVVALHVRLVDPGLDWLPDGGGLGVDIFFVLSGFLITALLLREQDASGRVSFGGFYTRRALRLLPALVVLLAAQLVYAISVNTPPAIERSSLLAVLFYYWNWKIIVSFPAIAPGLAHLWSLSVEEQFYLLWPAVVVCFLGVRRRLSTVVIVIGVAMAAVVIARIVIARHTLEAVTYYRTDLRADALLAGALAAHVWVRTTLPRRFLVPAAWLSLLFVVGCIVGTSHESKFLFNGGFTVFAFAVAIMLLAILDTRWPVRQVLSNRPLRAVGRVSYGLYLWHWFIFVVVARSLDDWPPLMRLVVALSASALATVGSWYLVERPFLRMKRRARPLSEVARSEVSPAGMP